MPELPPKDSYKQPKGQQMLQNSHNLRMKPRNSSKLLMQQQNKCNRPKKLVLDMQTSLLEMQMQLQLLKPPVKLPCRLLKNL
jgi:hypothetical protein